MHNHGHRNGGSHDSKMMWIMMLVCFVPIIFLALTGRGVGTNSIWWPLGAGAVMLGIHAFGMRGHGSHGHKDSAGEDTADHRPVAISNTGPADSSAEHPTANLTAIKGGHKHDCCE